MAAREGGDISYRDMVEVTQVPSPVQTFYEGRTIFITGATGFMGKILVEKLLRSCPGLTKMFILARPKKGKQIIDRFKEQFADPLYARLRREQPDFMDKLVFVGGDVGDLNLGLSPADYDTLSREVQIFFHGAATVRFDERLRSAVRINVRGTREVLRLARRMPRLVALLHVSTAYSNCTLKEIDEKFYDPPILAEKLIDLVESMDEEIIHKMTPILLDNYPNTYIFTKMVAENVVQEMAKGLPVAMVRPSIIVATSKEPVQGWIDNVYGPTGVVVGAAMGLMRTLYCDSSILADIIPVDYTINACLVATYEIGRNHETPNREQISLEESGWENCGPLAREVPIYNYVSSNQRPITWKLFMEMTERYGLEVPSVLAIWVYWFTLNKHRSVHMLYWVFLHTLPAYIVDTVAFCIGKKPKLVKAYEKIHKFSDVISYFSNQQWKFHNKNVSDLSKTLTPEDQQLFDFDISHLNWDDYFYSYVRGIRYYLAKDPFETLEAGRKKYKVLTAMHYAVCATFFYLFYRLSMFSLKVVGVL